MKICIHYLFREIYIITIDYKRSILMIYVESPSGSIVPNTL